MAMVNQPAARRHHRSLIAYSFGLLALLGAATTLVVVVRDPALSSTRLTAPVPAPEITVVGEDPPDATGVDDGPGALDAPFALGGPDPLDAGRAGGGDEPGATAGPDADTPAGTTQAARHTAEDVRQSLFWSGVFGLAISLAGLGLVGTRRRMW
ncbi:hypothetical protein NCC78_25695 [Micromonospora phytophila]|uniref:hypothetical protein n=1 Tax=Micromonospora phytophila TaxID=709888 RepID=UPI00202FF08C|nr:hypothetical protein [Micromonospora phytophila]MCM0678044.1 hypothetical protein [Micromonospora phytophila]